MVGHGPPPVIITTTLFLRSTTKQDGTIIKKNKKVVTPSFNKLRKGGQHRDLIDLEYVSRKIWTYVLQS